ncbi:MAG: Tyrosine--tRNA ligase [Chlamydiae bacterium]|nr:Tyrosine--tRNA ligase [Chlamydiota bacterium]
MCSKKISVYIGFDPTADSLHLGNLVGIIALGWFQKFGHKPIALAGGATGFIGDPTGKNSERSYLDAQTLKKNLKGIQKDLENILKFNPDNPVELLNNYDWHCKLSYLDFLRDVAQHFRISTLLARETVKERLKTQEGMSFKEFSYPLLQAYDFLHLFRKEDATLQLGGSDQWTNITSGMNLIKKVCQKEAYGLTFPLLTKSDGKKFGKSEQGAIWLSKDKLSPYDFYQYLYRTADQDVIKLLKMLTYLDIQEINAIEASMSEPNYQANAAQKILAKEVTEIVHGKEELITAVKVTESMRPGAKTKLDLATLKEMANELPHVKLDVNNVVEHKIIDVIISAQLLNSKGEARRLIQNGGLYLNNEKVDDDKFTLHQEHLIEEECLLLALGKKKKIVIFIER